MDMHRSGTFFFCLRRRCEAKPSFCWLVRLGGFLWREKVVKYDYGYPFIVNRDIIEGQYTNINNLCVRNAPTFESNLEIGVPIPGRLRI